MTPLHGPWQSPDSPLTRTPVAVLTVLRIGFCRDAMPEPLLTVEALHPRLRELLLCVVRRWKPTKMRNCGAPC
jgi:hypothetical protein